MSLEDLALELLSWSKSISNKVKMITVDIEYKIKTADAENVLTHLNKCKDNFIPVLDKTVDITDYSKQIVENSVTFEAWANMELIGLIAAYFNDKENHTGFITNVSVVSEYGGRGLAAELLKNCIHYAIEKNFKEINLEVSHKNEQAIRLYKKHDFYQTSVKDDLIIMKKSL